MVHEMYISPNLIRFTQNSISESFTDQEETIEDTFKQLLYRDITVDSIKRIVVVERNGDFWVISGNRRLYAYQKLEEYDFIEEIPVIVKPMIWERFSRKLTTKNGGKSVSIRQDKRRRRGDKMKDRLRNIYNEWVNGDESNDEFDNDDESNDELEYDDESNDDEFNTVSYSSGVRFQRMAAVVRDPPSWNISSLSQTQPKHSSELDRVMIHNPTSWNISSPLQKQPKPSSQLDSVMIHNPPSSKISPLPSSPLHTQPQTTPQLDPEPPTIRLEIPTSTSETNKKKHSWTWCTIL